MNPLEENLNAQLEQHVIPPGSARRQPNGSRLAANQSNPEIAKLVDAAHRFQVAPQLQVDPTFAALLERRMLRHALTHQQQRTTRGWSFLSAFRVARVRLALIGVCCLLLLGAGSLAFAHTTNPVAMVARLVQHVIDPSTSLADQAQTDLTSAHHILDILQNLTDQPGAYLKSLNDFETQRAAAASAVASLPAGSSKQRLSTQLSTLNSTARQELSAFLPTLPLDAGDATTQELGKLGMSVPSLTGATLILPTHPNEQATIILSGANLQSGARLLVNDKPLSATGTLRNGQLVFVLDWDGEQHPHSLGLLDPGGTVARTSQISIQGGNGKDNNGNGNGNSDKNSTGNGKPTATPTPRH